MVYSRMQKTGFKRVQEGALQVPRAATWFIDANETYPS